MTLTISPAQPVDALLKNFGPTARTLFAGSGRSSTVGAVVELARQTYGCNGVGLMLVGTESRPVAVGESDGDAAVADGLQLSLGQGPSLQAIERQQPVLVTEMRSDGRWRFWAPVAADLGFRSALALPLADGEVSGSLNLYSRTTAHFRSGDLAPALRFAQLASIAIAVAQERDQWLRAVEVHTIVGQAQGILMEVYGVTAEQASSMFRRSSSQLDQKKLLDHQKLRVIAEDVIRDRRLPNVDLGGRQAVDPFTALRA